MVAFRMFAILAVCVGLGLVLGVTEREAQAATRISGANCAGKYTCPVGTTVTGDFGVACTITGGEKLFCRFSNFWSCNSGGGPAAACVGTYRNPRDGAILICTQTSANCAD